MQKFKKLYRSKPTGMSTLLPLQAVFAEETSYAHYSTNYTNHQTERAATPVPHP